MTRLPKSSTHRKRLELLQKERGVGTWVQCCRPVCNKWRYLDQVKDPVEIPNEWFCYMNPNKKFASCSFPENGPSALEEDDFIHNIYTAGSIVWAKLSGYPWWPALVDDCPDTEQYYWLNEFSDIPTHYNVVFFDSNTITRAWIPLSFLKPFNSSSEKFATIIGKHDYTDRIEFAKNQAQQAKKLDVEKRLKKYSFLARWKGPIITPKNIKRKKTRKHKITYN